MMARPPRTLPCSYGFDGFCDSCGNDEPTKQTHLGHICSDCRTLCPVCGDWLLLDYVAIDGKRYHVDCAVELEALTDALVAELTISPAEVVMLAHYSDLIGGAE